MNTITLDELTFQINEEEKTAKVISSQAIRNDIVIPRSISFNNQDYIVTCIGKGSFYKNALVSLSFPDDSKLETIEKDSFEDSKIKSISLPESLKELKKGWCNGTYNLINVSIHPNNKSISKKNKMLFGKTEENVDSFDAILFAERNIECVIIPENIKEIRAFSFSGCDNIEEFKIMELSQLSSIDKEAFSYSNITSISIPPTVKKIKKNAFFECRSLVSIDIPQSSKLDLLKFCSIFHTSIDTLYIPSQLILQDGWCCGTSKLNSIIVSSNNPYYIFINKMLIEKESGEYCLKFASRNIEDPKISPFISKIDSFAFAECGKMKYIEFLPSSSLRLIGPNAFYKSSLKSIFLPSNVNNIATKSFLQCQNLTSVQLLGDKLSIEIGSFFDCPIKIISCPNPLKIKINLYGIPKDAIILTRSNCEFLIDG